MKRYTEEDLLKKYKRAFRIDYVTGIGFFIEFKPIGIVLKNGKDQWYAYMIEKDLICLWGVGLPEIIPWAGLSLDDKYYKAFGEFNTNTRPWPSKKERMQKVLSLLKDYYKELIGQERLRRKDATEMQDL